MGDWKILASLDKTLRHTGNIGPDDMRSFKKAELNGFELYNLREDAGETKDLAASEPKKLQTMAGTFRELYHAVREESPVWPAWVAPPYERERIKWFTLDDLSPGYHLYWGDMHAQFKPQWSEGNWDVFLDESFEAARDYLDFFPIVYYPATTYFTKGGLRMETAGRRDEFQPEWEQINAKVKKYHQPGKFVTFAGYEWTGDRTRWGDHNVFYFHDDQPLDLSLHIDELLASLRQRKAIAIPHHTAYMPGNRSKDWGHHDEAICPFVEVFSAHGCSEGCDSTLDMAFGPRTSGGSVQDGLARGYRLGIMASGDNSNGFPGRHGLGLMACYATELTREALWDAFLARRVYGVTGDRMQLDFRIDNHFMGEVFRSSGPVTAVCRVVGSHAIDRIELVKNNRVLTTHCHSGTWTMPTEGNVRIKVRLEHGWGPAPQHGLKTADKQWHVDVKTIGAKIVSCEGCFTRRGQKILSRSDTQCSYRLTTSPRGQGAVGSNGQSIVLEIEGDLDAKMHLACEELERTFTLRELLQAERCLLVRKQVEAAVRAELGQDADSIETLEHFLCHNSYKIRLHRAVPEASYTAELRFTDEKSGQDRDFYYLRVSQINGQYAWSSPIWVER